MKGLRKVLIALFVSGGVLVAYVLPALAGDGGGA